MSAAIKAEKPRSVRVLAAPVRTGRIADVEDLGQQLFVKDLIDDAVVADADTKRPFRRRLSEKLSEVPVLVMGRVIMRNLSGCSGAVPSACHS